MKDRSQPHPLRGCTASTLEGTVEEAAVWPQVRKVPGTAEA